MSVSRENQKNLWGRQAVDGDISLEPQRSDLWYVDLDGPVRGINRWFQRYYLGEQLLPELSPQFVQSVSFPNFETKAESFRRANIPYNMPSWDSPLEPLKVVFLIAQSDLGKSAVYDFITRWQGLVRLGRGSRDNQGPSLYDRWPAPDDAAVPEFRFDFIINLLRGGPRQLPSRSVLVEENSKAQVVQQQRRRLADALKVKGLFSGTPSSASSQANYNPVSVTPVAVIAEARLETACVFRVCRAWLSSFHISELSYTQPQLVSIETQIYAESINTVYNSEFSDVLP